MHQERLNMNKTIILIAIIVGFTAGYDWAEGTDTASTGNADLATIKIVKEPVPVTAWNRTIAVFRADYESYTAKDRAKRASNRIKALPGRSDLDIRVIKASVKDLNLKGYIIATETETLFALLPGDVDPESGATLEAVAKDAADRLKAVLAEHGAQTKWPTLLRGFGFSAAATLVYLLVVWGIFRIKNRTMARLDRVISEWKHPISIAGIDLVPILLGIERFIARISLLAAFLVMTYIWVTFCFARFFFTEPWARQLGGYLVNLLITIALGVVRAVPGLFMVVVIFWLTRIVAAGVSQFFTRVERERITVSWLQPDSARASRRIVLAILWIFSLTIVYPYIPGSGSDAFKGISVFAGLMISIGSSGFVNHVMSGLVIAYSGAMRVGDYVSLNNIEGTVEELGPMSTKIATVKKEFVTIPNGVVISAHVTNYSRLAGRDGAIISTTVTIGYDAPWRQIQALLLQAAEKTAGIRNSPAPFVLQRALSDFYIEYELRARIDQPVQRVTILSALHGEIQDAFNEAGVQIMSPHFMYQPENAVVVPESQWYAPPAVQKKQDLS